MRKIHLRVLAIAACLIFVALWVSIQATQEPKFEGRNLSEWISLIDVPAQQWTNPLVRQAIQTIGSDALPYLMKSISEQSSYWYRLKVEISKRFRNFRDYQQAAHIHQEQTMAAFELLGHRAEPALPALCNLLDQEQTAKLASRAIQNIGTEKAALELAKASTNHTLKFRFFALDGLRKMGSAAKPVMPILVQAIDANTNYLDFFIHPMEQIDLNQTIAVLQRLATNSQPQLRLNAQAHLTRLAPRAAMPRSNTN